MMDFLQPYVSQEPEFEKRPIPHNAIPIATHDEAKPIRKIISKMLQPRHQKTHRFTKRRVTRRTKKNSYY